MPAAPVSVKISGLRELDRALGRADKNLRQNLRTRLTDIADIVSVEARALASSRTSADTGALVRGIRPYVAQGRAGVRSNAVHRGFEYPKRLEFEGRRGGTVGPRASLNPAVDRRLTDINHATEKLLDELADDFTAAP